MYKKLAALTVVGALTLGGCATNPTTGLPTIDPTQLTTIETQVQQDAAQVCGFVPTIGTIAAIIASFVPGAAAVTTIATQVANQICAAVTPVKASLTSKTLTRRTFGVLPSVNGVPIQGYFIK